MSAPTHIKRTLFIIVASLYFVAGGSYKIVNTYRSHPTLSSPPPVPPPAYLRYLIQTGPQKEALKTPYLAELMKISADQPVLTALFDIKQGKKNLLSSPVIKEGSIQIIKPDTLYVDYTVRQPQAWINDFENTAIDEDGYPFPVVPFFSPKNLPQFYLGLEQVVWNQPLSGQTAKLALTLLRLLPQLPFQVKKIDISKAFHPSLGTREIIFTLDEKEGYTFLRLTPKNFSHELGDYIELRSQIKSVNHVIDLRIPQLAFITLLKKRDQNISDGGK